MNGNTSFTFSDSQLEDKKNDLINGYEYDMCSLKEWEKIAILDCLDKCNGNITKAAGILGINRSTLHSRINEYNKETTIGII